MRKKPFLVLLLLVLGFLLIQIKKAKPSIWDGQSRINFVLSADQVGVVSLEPDKNMTIFLLPDNLYLDVPHGFGQYRVGAVYELGELEKKGGELLMETIQSYLGLPIDGYIRMANGEWRIANGKKFILNCLLLSLLRKGKTSFNHWDILRLGWQINKLRVDRIDLFDLVQTSILSEAKLADGSVILETEFFRLDEVAGQCCYDSKVRNEALSIEVLNATDFPGLANQFTRLVTNVGGTVVAIGNSSIKYQVSSIKYQKKELVKSYTLQKLEKILGVKAEVGERGESRADLLIIIGEDYWQVVK
jgi:hypothetical protein